MAGEFPKAGRLFNKFLRITLGNYLKLKFNIRLDKRVVEGLKPPYIVLANHTNFWDPFILSLCIPEPVYFVTSDAYFRNPLLRRLLKMVGAIPKTKSVSDPASIKNIISIVKNRGIIGIYPEGRRNWDGTTLPLVFPTAKLVKSLKLPVVSVLSRGACLSMPRWARKTRKGILSVTCSRIMDAADCEAMDAGEIFERLTKSLAYDEYEFQRKSMIPFEGSRLAENLELFLFACPDCKSLEGMVSSGDTLKCSSCGLSVQYDRYGFLKTLRGESCFDNPRDWNKWQLEYLESTISAAVLQSGRPAGSAPILQEQRVRASAGEGPGPMKNKQDVRSEAMKNRSDQAGRKPRSIIEIPGGSLALYGGRIDFKSRTGDVTVFNISGISGENIQYNNMLEFFYEKVLYRFWGNYPGICAYKWVRAIEICRKTSQSEGR